MKRLILAVVCCLAPWVAVGQTTPELDAEIAADIEFLKEAGVRSDGPALLEYLRKQTLKDGERDNMAAILQGLDDKSFQKREKAVAEMIAQGPKALPVLRAATVGATLEMRMRIERCIKELEKNSPAQIAGAVVRLLKHRKAPGASAVLLAYVTSAPDETVEEEILAVLPVIGVSGGQADALFQPALSDSSPVKRAAAVLVLGRFGTRNQRALVHLLLDDPHPAVRLRAAHGLLLGRDQSAIPALIGLLVKSPLAIAEQAEDMLTELAGDTVPAVTLGETTEARMKCYQAWRDWWQLRQTKINLARMDLDPLANSDGTAKARQVARQFIIAVFKNDRPVIRKTSELPFVIAGLERIETREAWENLLAQVGQNPQAQQTKFAVQKVISLDEYAKTGQPEERPFLEKMKKMSVRVVLGWLEEGGNRQEPLSMFVRITGARARVIGIGSPRGGKEKPRGN
jgi:hypothetical protein